MLPTNGFAVQIQQTEGAAWEIAKSANGELVFRKELDAHRYADTLECFDTRVVPHKTFDGEG